MAQGLNTLAQALALRLRQIARMLDRVDRLEAGSGEWLDNQDQDLLVSASREAALRTLRIAADPVNFEILSLLLESATMPVPALENATGLDRFTLNERINDLIQASLISREIDTDVVQIGDAGVALVHLFRDIYQETARQLEAYLEPVTRLDD